MLRPDPIVTFIVPTIWRPTLKRAVDSLVAQTDANGWQAYVLGDGNGHDGRGYLNFRGTNWYGHPDADPWAVRDDETKDPRLHFGWGQHQGSAGLTRNLALKCWDVDGQQNFAYDTEWVGFLDDDDALSPHYVEHLREHAEAEPSADVVVFRMDHPTLGILPDLTEPRLEWGRVGISYAVRARVLGQDPFVRERLDRPGPEGNEDIQLLLRLIDEGRDVLISPHVDYIVRPDWRR